MDTEKRNCQNCKKGFTVEAEDFDFYKQMKVPPPTWCPECRMMRRLAFWNERNFFKKIEKRTAKEIFSMWPAEALNEIYERDYWTSDAWDPKQYAREIDWNRPFLEQLRELQFAVPWAARAVQRMVNSDYSNNAADLKNCYMCFNADASEDCAYGVNMNRMKSCIDFSSASYCELSYDFHTSGRCYQCFFVSNCTNCRNVWLSDECEDCSDCFGCVNLRHKQYCIFNVQYTKEEYMNKIKEMDLGSHDSLLKWKKQFEVFKKNFPRKYMHGFQNNNSAGDYIYNSKNTIDSYNVLDSENVRYVQNVALGLKETYDYTNWGNNSEFMYETVACGEYDQRLKFCWECWPSCQDMEYSMACRSSKNLFGCVGLKKSEYCILNKQYTKEEYVALLPKLKKHMVDMPYIDARGRVYAYGEFFPPEFSFIAANESAIVDFMDFPRERALEYGLSWRETSPREYQVTMQASDLPDRIGDAPEDISNMVIGCVECRKGYRIMPVEMEFLKRFGIPLPRYCFQCRARARLNQRNLPVWYKRSCQCAGERSTNNLYINTVKHPHLGVCPVTFTTAFAPTRPEIVYCESCYQQEVV